MKRYVNKNKSDEKPIWYVFIDDSGHPYYRIEDPGPFTLGAVISNDPERIAKIALTKPSKSKFGTKNQVAPGKGELKHTSSSRKICEQVMSELDDPDFVLVAAKQQIDQFGDYSRQNSSAIYGGTLSRLLIRIAEKGPAGLYRVRLDKSEYIDQELLETISIAAFTGYDDKTLAKKDAVLMVDSELYPAAQTADMFAGEFRYSLKDENSGFVNSHNVILANKKCSQGRPTEAKSSATSARAYPPRGQVSEPYAKLGANLYKKIDRPRSKTRTLTKRI